MEVQVKEQERLQQPAPITGQNQADLQELINLLQSDPELMKMLGLATNHPSTTAMERVDRQIGPTSPLGLIQDARTSLSHAWRSTQSYFTGHPGINPSTQSRPWVWMTAMAAIAGVTVASCFAVVVNAIANNAPNQNITAQQEANAALMMEVAKSNSRPNVTCLLAWNCPDVPVEQPTEIKGSQLSVSYGAPEGVDPKQYQGWVNYWNEKATPELHEAANTFTPKMCSDRPGMCDALNAVKAARMQK